MTEDDYERIYSDIKKLLDNGIKKSIGKLFDEVHELKLAVLNTNGDIKLLEKDLINHIRDSSIHYTDEEITQKRLKRNYLLMNIVLGIVVIINTIIMLVVK